MIMGAEDVVTAILNSIPPPFHYNAFAFNSLAFMVWVKHISSGNVILIICL
jgi:hypothetical protein